MFAIPNIKYNKAHEYLKNGNYDKAYKQFKELDDFKDSELLAEEAMYHKGIEIKKYGYSDAKVFIALNDDEYKEEPFSDIYYGDRIYCHISYYSPSFKKAELKASCIWPDGSVTYREFDFKYENGIKNIFWVCNEELSSDDVGEFKIRIYDKNSGELMAEGSIRMINSKAF